MYVYVVLTLIADRIGVSSVAVVTSAQWPVQLDTTRCILATSGGNARAATLLVHARLVIGAIAVLGAFGLDHWGTRYIIC